MMVSYNTSAIVTVAWRTVLQPIGDQNGAYAKCAATGMRPGEFFKLCPLCLKLHPVTFDMSLDAN